VTTYREILDGRYRLDEIIGQGGMATVYRARDLRLNRPLAAKVMRPQAGLSEAVQADFLREARIIARLNHPNVVALHDAGITDGGRPYLIMELLPGTTLRDRLSQGPLPVEEALRVALGVAAALDTAHGRGILHLDVKPENILFDGSGTPKLSDFGISHSLAEEPSRTKNSLFGTAAYLAPEQVRNGPLDARADVYGLGLLLYEMLAGARPFWGETPMQQATQRLVVDPPALKDLNPAVTPALSRVVMRALERDPARRFGSMADFALALRNYERATQRRTTLSSAVEAPPARKAPSPTRKKASRQGRGIAWAMLWVMGVLCLGAGFTAALLAGMLPDLPVRAEQPSVALPAEEPPPTLVPIFFEEPAPELPPVTVTLEPPTATPEPATPTAEPPTPEPATATPEPAPLTEMSVLLEDAEWQGSYRRSGGESYYGGRTATWIYGRSTDYSSMQATVNLEAQPTGMAALTIVGMDSEDEEKTPISIQVNGVELLSGPSPFPDHEGTMEQGNWGSFTWTFDGSLLRPGPNTVTISNHAEGAFSRPPWFMLDYAELTLVHE
jgi:serine/threonine-protein kinase